VALVDRARAMISSPAQEWPAVAAEPATIPGILQSYVLPLALIGPVCGLIGNFGFLHRGAVYGAAAAVLGFILEIVGLFVVTFIADATVASFGGVKDSVSSFKWIAYSSTARWVAGVFALIPVIGAFVILVASVYSLYVLFLGTVPVMRVPAERAAGFTIVVIIAYIVVVAIVSVLLGILLTLFFAGALMATGAVTH
jgi:Yip1 domain